MFPILLTVHIGHVHACKTESQHAFYNSTPQIRNKLNTYNRTDLTYICPWIYQWWFTRTNDPCSVDISVSFYEVQGDKRSIFRRYLCKFLGSSWRKTHGMCKVIFYWQCLCTVGFAQKQKLFRSNLSFTYIFNLPILWLGFSKPWYFDNCELDLRKLFLHVTAISNQAFYPLRNRFNHSWR